MFFNHFEAFSCQRYWIYRYIQNKNHQDHSGACQILTMGRNQLKYALKSPFFCEDFDKAALSLLYLFFQTKSVKSYLAARVFSISQLLDIFGYPWFFRKSIIDVLTLNLNPIRLNKYVFQADKPGDLNSKQILFTIWIFHMVIW